MQYHLLATVERRAKTERIMESIRPSLDARPGITLDVAPRGEPFVIWGHLFNGLRAVPQALEDGTPFYFVDNGYFEPAKGSMVGYYALTYRSFSPQFLDDPDMSRLPTTFKEWRDPAQHPDRHVLVTVPGEAFGQMFKWDMRQWVADVEAEIRKHTDRRIVVRRKDSRTPYEQDMANAAVVVTHTSKSAVDAIREGIPVICEPLCSAGPVSGHDLSQIETPPMPDREKWWASLMCQQFTPDEFRRGAAREWLRIAAEQGERDIKTGWPAYSVLLGEPDFHQRPASTMDPPAVVQTPEEDKPEPTNADKMSDFMHALNVICARHGAVHSEDRLHFIDKRLTDLKDQVATVERDRNDYHKQLDDTRTLLDAQRRIAEQAERDKVQLVDELAKLKKERDHLEERLQLVQQAGVEEMRAQTEARKKARAKVRKRVGV